MVPALADRGTTPRVLRTFAVFAAALISACASLPDNIERPISEAYSDTQDTQLGQAVLKQTRSRPNESGFLLVSDGLDAFVARTALAQAAERSIDAQYYLLNDDSIGALFVDQLIDAADRGVKVRLLVDDMDLGGRTLGAAALDSHPNVEVRLFNPFHRGASRSAQLVARFGSVTRRMHNKSFTVDNQAAILGGRNIGDEYFEADAEVSFTDIDVLLIGPVVKEVSESFDRYWNSELAYPAIALLGRAPSANEYQQKYEQLKAKVEREVDPAYRNALRNTDLADRIRTHDLTFDWGPAQVVYDAPEKVQVSRSATHYHLSSQLRPLFEGIRRELLIISPYFVPGKRGTAFLTDLADRGVKVGVVTNSLSATDVPVVHAGYSRYRKALLRAGVELFEFKSDAKRPKRFGDSGFSGSSSASLHTKAFLFDRHKFFIGSMNLDPRSSYENTEVGVVFTSPVLGAQVSRDVERALPLVAYRLDLTTGVDGSEQIIWHEPTATGQVMQVHSVDPETSFWVRFWTGLVGLLPIESQL